MVNIQFTSSSCENVFLGERSFPCRTVQISEMLLADYVYAFSTQLFNLIAINCLEWAKHPDITGLEFMGGVRGETT